MSGVVQKALSSIKSTTAPGHDKFTGFVLKPLPSALALDMTIIFNGSLQNNSVPTSRKMVEVRAVYITNRKEAKPIQTTIHSFIHS